MKGYLGTLAGTNGNVFNKLAEDEQDSLAKFEAEIREDECQKMLAELQEEERLKSKSGS